MAERPLHFDGPMMIGGSAYSLDDVVTGVTRPRLLTGLAHLDKITAGFGAGEVWAVEGMGDTGVTAFCNKALKSHADRFGSAPASGKGIRSYLRLVVPTDVPVQSRTAEIQNRYDLGT